MSVATIFWLSVQVGLFSLFGALSYALLRRRGASAGVACAALVLGLSLPLALLAVSPWPRWEMPQRIAMPKQEVAATEAAKAGALNGFDENLATIESTETLVSAEGAMDGAAWQSVLEWIRKAGEPAPVDPSQASVTSWSSAVLWLLVVGLTLGLARFAYGLVAVRGYRRNSRPIDSGELATAVEELRQRLQAPTVEVRETAQIRSAATIGWRRPLLLLPVDWQMWTENERRVVLAHELAHVARNDYMLVMIARAATTIHFYQPLLLWLARQLRLQQELAADAQAAAVIGSRQSYLTTLAEMALRADDCTIPWPARAFLPDTSLLVKRVSWLRNNKTSEERTMNRRSCWMLAAALSTIALVVALVRVPGHSVVATVAAAEPNETAGDKPVLESSFVRSNKYVPANAAVLVMISPSRIVRVLPATAIKAAALVDDNLPFEKPVIDFEDIQLSWKFDASNRTRFSRGVYQTIEPFDWLAFIVKRMPKSQPMEERRFDEETYRRILLKPEDNIGMSGEFFFIIPDNRTLVVTREEDEMRKILAEAPSMPIEQFQEVKSKPLAFMVDGNWLKHAAATSQGADPISLSFGPIVSSTDRIVATANLKQTESPKESLMSIDAKLQCSSDEAASSVHNTLSALATLAGNYLRGQESLLAERRKLPEIPQNEIAAVQALLAIGNGFMQDLAIQLDTDSVAVTSSVRLEEGTFNTVLLPALQAGREAAMRNQSQNNLKAISLASLNYLEANKRLPAPAILGKDGKNRHSWRVAILPYLDQQALYNEYRFDEPWDSEHNRKLIAKMPAFYRDPHVAKDSTNSCYFMITGKGTIGDTENGRRPREIIDGMSKTIMLVDAKRDIPWTKPEDIEIDADKPLPAFGGFLEPKGMFLAAFCDGSVRAMAPDVDPNLLRKLFTVGGKEPVDNAVWDN